MKKIFLLLLLVTNICFCAILEPFPFKDSNLTAQYPPFNIYLFGHSTNINTNEITLSPISTFFTIPTVDTVEISSSNNGDSTEIYISGVNNGINYTESVILNGTSSVTLSHKYNIINFAKNIGTKNILGDIYIYLTTTITGGVPIDSSKILSKINSTTNTTENGFFYMPVQYKGIINYLNFQKITGDTSEINIYVTRGTQPKIKLCTFLLTDMALNPIINYPLFGNDFFEVTAIASSTTEITMFGSININMY